MMTSTAFKNAIKNRKNIFLCNVTLPLICHVLIAFSYSAIWFADSKYTVTKKLLLWYGHQYCPQGHGYTLCVSKLSKHKTVRYSLNFFYSQKLNHNTKFSSAKWLLWLNHYYDIVQKLSFIAFTTSTTKYYFFHWLRF